MEQVPRIQAIFQGLSSTDNATRSASEKVLTEEWISTQPQAFLCTLVILMNVDEAAMNRALAAVLFRKTILDGGNKNWLSLGQENQVNCQKGLLECWIKETSSDVRNKIGDCIGQVARIHNTHHQSWEELMNMIWQLDASSGQEKIVSVLRIVETAPEVINGENIPQFTQSLARFLGIDFDCASAAIKAIVSVVSCLSKPAQKIQFEPILAQLPNTLASFYQSTPDLELGGIILDLVELADDYPKLFRNSFPTYISFLTAILKNSGDENEENKSSSLELLTSLCENCPKAIIRQSKGKGGDTIAEITFLILSNIANNLDDDISDWLSSTPDDELDEESLSLIAEQCLDRISIALGGENILPPLMTFIPQMLASTQWKQKYAALRAIADMAEGCSHLLQSRLDDLLGIVWPMFHDEHPRVQYGACHALGQLCTDFSGPLQEKFAKEALSSLIHLLMTSRQARVQSHAAAAMINFAEGVDPIVIEPMLSDLIERLVSLASDPASVIYLKEHVVGAIAAFASAAGPSFTASALERVMPIIISLIVQNSQQQQREAQAEEEQRPLQCKALETATIIACAVGKQRFSPFIQTVMDFMIHQQQTKEAFDSTDPMLEYLPSAFVRMAQVMGPEFASLLTHLLPELLEQASVEPDVAVIDDPKSEEAYDESEWDFATVRGRRLGIHTATLDAKCIAIENISVYISSLGSAYEPFVQETFSVLSPLVNFSLHEGVQCAAVEALSALVHLESPQRQQLATNTFLAITSTLKDYDAIADCDPEYTSAALDALSSILGFYCKGDGGGEALLKCKNILDCIVSILNETLEDEEDGENEADEYDAEILFSSARLSGSILKVYGPSALGAIESIFNFSVKSINSLEGYAKFKHASFCLLADIVTHAGQESSAHAHTIAECLVKGLQISDDLDSKQAAIFSIGKAAQKAPLVYADFIKSVTPSHLLKYLEHSENIKEPTQALITDNVLAALSRISDAFPSKFPALKIFPLWIRGLPVTHDTEEVATVYGWLLRTLKSDQHFFDGLSQEELACVLVAFVTVLVRGLLKNEAELLPAIMEMTTAIKEKMNHQAMQDCLLANFTNDQLAKLF